MKSETTNRRSFLKKSSLALSSAIAAPAILHASANEKIRVGFIGVGNRGTQVMGGFMKQPDVQIAALCDVYQPCLDRVRSNVDQYLLETLQDRIPQMGEKFEPNVKKFTDFRRLLEDKDIDAVVIATPDHWHAIQTIQACEAGKDVYVEKPLSLTVHEGRKMVEAAERTKRVVQVGLHRRSSKLYQKTHEIIQAGGIGKVTIARSYRISNMSQSGIGLFPAKEPVKGLDWDMWLGPSPKIDYKDNIAPYKFRWWQAFSSQIGNWGVHYFDTIRWCLDSLAPVSVSAHGGRFAVKDDRTIPDTAEIIFELPCGALMLFGQYEANGGDMILHQAEIEFRGTTGNLFSQGEGGSYLIEPTEWGQFQNNKIKIEPQKSGKMDGDLTEQHVRNFVDCIKSRNTPNCSIEDGHRSATFAHLANIALATKSRIEWDAKTERITQP